MEQMMQRQLVKPQQTTANGGIVALAILSGESEKRLQVFAKVHRNKSFSKQAAFEAFAGVARKKAS